jgi:hypothetical protein
MAPIRPLKKPLHHLHKGPHTITHSLTNTTHSRTHSRARPILDRPTSFRAEMAQQLASNAPNQAASDDGRGFRGNQDRIKEDEEKRRKAYLIRLRNLLLSRRNKI